MRLNNKTFKIGTLRRRRRKLGRISNFKWLEAALNLVEIKNPFGSVQTNPQADAWWVPLFIFLKKVFFWNTLMYRVFNLLVYWSGFLLLWTILELSIECNMYFHKLSRQTPPHQVADGQWMTRNHHLLSQNHRKKWKWNRTKGKIGVLPNFPNE